MGIVWLIEDPSLQVKLSGDLCANFAVRTVASLESLSHLLLIEQQLLPDVLVCRCPQSLATQNVLNIIRCHTDVPVVLVSESEDYRICLDDKYMIHPLNFEVSSLFSVIRRLLRRESADIELKGSVIKYKHLSLDNTSHHVDSACGRLAERLPAKEAGILKILIPYINLFI